MVEKNSTDVNNLEKLSVHIAMFRYMENFMLESQCRCKHCGKGFMTLKFSRHMTTHWRRTV
jgi:hypothetical protein